MKILHSLTAALTLTMLAIATQAHEEEAPRYYDSLAKGQYMLVILGEGGKAEFLHHINRDDGTVWLYHDEAATWGYFPDLPKNARPNMYVKTGHGRFDFFAEDSQLTEIDKAGVQGVLKKREPDRPEMK